MMPWCPWCLCGERPFGVWPKWKGKTLLRHKHIPQRTCAGCARVQPKRQMVRVVRSLSGKIVVDDTGKLPGRGTYLCKSSYCWEKALNRSALARALKTELTPEDREELLKHSRLFGSTEKATQSAPEAEGEAGS